MAFDPRKVLEDPNFCKNFISDNKISYTCRMECQQHTEKRIMWFCSIVAKLGCSKTIRGSNAIVLYSALCFTFQIAPRKFLEQPNFATIEQNHIILVSVCCWHSILQVYEILLSEMKFLQKLGSSKTFRGSNAIVSYSTRPSEGEGSDVITV